MNLFFAVLCMFALPTTVMAGNRSIVTTADTVPVVDSLHAGSGPTNTFIGYDASSTKAGVSNATAIGANAKVAVSNALVLGNGVNVGIGTDSPLVRLHLTSGINGQSGLRLENLTSATPASLTASSALTVDPQGNVVLGAITGSLWQQTTEGYTQSISSKGVLIGNPAMLTPAGYSLFVSDGILTEKVKVAIQNSADWADNVFAANYRLRSLADTKRYIDQHGHLPGIPSADEVVANGVDLGRINAQLLAKIEELTLHLIYLEKRVHTLETQRKPRVQSVTPARSPRRTTAISQ